MYFLAQYNKRWQLMLYSITPDDLILVLLTLWQWKWQPFRIPYWEDSKAFQYCVHCKRGPLHCCAVCFQLYDKPFHHHCVHHHSICYMTDGGSQYCISLYSILDRHYFFIRNYYLSMYQKDSNRESWSGVAEYCVFYMHPMDWDTKGLNKIPKAF